MTKYVTLFTTSSSCDLEVHRICLKTNFPKAIVECDVVQIVNSETRVKCHIMDVRRDCRIDLKGSRRRVGASPRWKCSWRPSRGLRSKWQCRLRTRYSPSSPRYSGSKVSSGSLNRCITQSVVCLTRHVERASSSRYKEHRGTSARLGLRKHVNNAPQWSMHLIW